MLECEEDWDQSHAVNNWDDITRYLATTPIQGAPHVAPHAATTVRSSVPVDPHTILGANVLSIRIHLNFGKRDVLN